MFLLTVCLFFQLQLYTLCCQGFTIFVISLLLFYAQVKDIHYYMLLFYTSAFNSILNIYFVTHPLITAPESKDLYRIISLLILAQDLNFFFTIQYVSFPFFFFSLNQKVCEPKISDFPK